ncbi:flagellar biosynthesis protein FlhG [Nitrosovibrio sp. Nv6]|nr:flagellar biosynthesis protein FlhG [Nitrosovibrio sp. Nv6]
MGPALAEPIHDQAEGLRRLLVQDFLRVITVTSGNTGAGRTTAVINLAAALARNGRNVLVIDENASASNVSATLGLNAHRDLLDVIRRDKTLDDVIISGPEGFFILPAGRGMRVLEKLSADDRAYLIGCFAHLAQPVDLVLIDAAPGRSSCLLPFTFSTHEIVVIVSPEPPSITAAYALIKHISGFYHDKRRNFNVLVNRARNETEAQMIFDNMAGAARCYLEVELDFMGFIPQDRKLCLGPPVAGTFQPSASAIAFHHVAELLTDRPRQDAESATEGRGLERFMQGLLQSSQSSIVNGLSTSSR